MNSEVFNSSLILKSPKEALDYLRHNREEIRYLFQTVAINRENTDQFAQVLLSILSKDFSPKELEDIILQSIFVHLAYYFKRANKDEYLDTCFGFVTNRYFRLRLDAWIKIRRYHTFHEHISQFQSYLTLITDALDETDDGNGNELLQDIEDYQHYAKEHLSHEVYTELNGLFTSKELEDQFPLLAQYNQRESDEIANLNIQPYDNHEYKPSDFVDNIFNTQFLNLIRQNSPDFPNRLFGLRSSEIRFDIIKQGQANFDQKYKGLSSQNVTDLYCYFNMRMHFYSTLSLLERSNFLSEYYNSSGKIKFVDLGCGPGTSGLSLTDYIHTKTKEKVVFDYYGIDSSKSMTTKASQILRNAVFSKINELKFFTNFDEIDLQSFRGASCIVINCCFVFASATLPIEDIAIKINQIARHYPFIPKYLLYQNSVKKELNNYYEKFKTLLNNFDVELEGTEEIRYHNVQFPTYRYKTVYGKFEVLKLA